MQDFLQEAAVSGTVRVFLALVFVTAAVPKLRHRDEFFGVLRNFRLLPGLALAPVALLLPLAELAVAAGLLIPATVPVAAGAAALLFAVFGAAIAINILRGRSHIDCGCMRNGMRQELSWWLVARNLVLVLLAAGLAISLPPAGMDFPEILVALVAGSLFTLIYLMISMLGGLVARSPHLSSRQGR